MTLSLRLKLKPQFREPLAAQGGFVGREAELSRLVSLFQRRSSATVLVSGHRGVGKSALVEEALSRAQGDKTKRVIARLTLPHVYRDDIDSTKLRDQILRSLARALYFALKDEKLAKDLRERVEALYSKTYLKELEEHTAVESLAEAEVKRQATLRTETTFQPSKLVSMIGGGALAAGAAVGGVAVVSKVASTHGVGWAIAAAAAIPLAAIASSFALSKVKSEETSVGETLTERNEVTRVGIFDLSPETLEFELRDLILQLAKAKRPCVFIIDELDKLEALPASEEELEHLESHVIFKIVSALKNFFTLGSGIYVFISGEDFYGRLTRSIGSEVYALAHTLFTDRVFVHVLHYSEVERLIDQLLAETSTDETTYRRFRNYLCWESRNHVFDLLTLVGEYVVFDDKGVPMLVAQEAGEQDGRWREGNLPDGWQIAAGLEKFVGAVYDESHRPTAREERFNQALWLTLLQTARGLFDGGSIEIPEGGYELPDTKWMNFLSDGERDDLAGVVERLLAKMERYASVTTASGSRTLPSEEEEREVKFVRHELVEDPPYPPSTIGTEAQHTNFENGFLDLARRVEELIEKLRGAGLDASQLADDLKATRNLAEAVKNTSPRSTVPRSRVREGIKRGDALAQQLVEFGVDGVVTKWAADHGAQASEELTEVENRTQLPWESSLTEFPDLVNALKEADIDYFIVGGASSENQMLVLNDWGEDELASISDAYSKALTGEKGRERRKQRLPIVVVSHAPEGKVPKIPQEVVEVIEESTGFSFLKLFSRTWKRERKAELAGWNPFALGSELDNLDKLAGFIDQVSFVNP